MDSSQLQVAQTIKYCRVSSVAIWILDYLLTFNDERRFLGGKRKWGMTQVAFLIARYLPAVGCAVTLYAVTLPPTETNKCMLLYGITGVDFIVTMIAAEGLLCIRTVVLWHNCWRMRLLLTAAFIVLVAYILTSFGLSVADVGLAYDPNQNDMIVTDCLSLDEPYDTIGVGSVACFELLVCFVTAYRAFQLSSGTTASRLLRALCEGSLLYTAALFGMTAANVFVELFVHAGGRSDSLDQLQMVLHSVLASRILFGLRNAISDPRLDVEESLLLTTMRFDQSARPRGNGSNVVGV